MYPPDTRVAQDAKARGGSRTTDAHAGALESSLSGSRQYSYYLTQREMINMTQTLTAQEIKFVNGMRNNEYNDAIEGPTWTFTAIDYSGMKGSQARGVMSSLVQKGFIWAEKGDKQAGDEDTVGFTEAGVALFDNADGEECTWGGKPLLKELEEPKKFTNKEIQVRDAAKRAAMREAREVTVLAFTGMPIGTFAVSSETTKTVTISTAKGAELIFDKATGIQTNAKNPKFANKIQKEGK